ncbi:MAG: hypothetical protein ACRDRG_17745 [Pseudonocardiaceae bacterium]
MISRRHLYMVAGALFFSLLVSSGCGANNASDVSAQAASDAGGGSSETVEMRKVDPPPGKPPEITMKGTPGVTIYRDWISDGKYERYIYTEPLRWPKVNFDKTDIRIETAAAPYAVELRYFTRPLDGNGVPVQEPAVQKCEVVAPDRRMPPCKISLTGTFCNVSFELGKEVQAAVLNVSWYVPSTLREELPDAPSVNTIAVGWTRASA